MSKSNSKVLNSKHTSNDNLDNKEEFSVWLRRMRNSTESKKEDRNPKQNARPVKGSRRSLKARKRKHLTPAMSLREKQRREIDRRMNKEARAEKKKRGKKRSPTDFKPTVSSTPVSNNRKSLHFSRRETVDNDETDSMASSSNIDNRRQANESRIDEQLSASVIPETQPHDTIIPETQDVPETEDYIPETQDSDVPATQDFLADSVAQAQLTQTEQQAESQDNISNITAQQTLLQTPVRSRSKVSVPSNRVPKVVNRSADATPSQRSKTTATNRLASLHESAITIEETQDEEDLIAANGFQSLDIDNSELDSHFQDSESRTSIEMVKIDQTPRSNRTKTTKPKDRGNLTKNPPIRSKSKTKQLTATEGNTPATDQSESTHESVIAIDDTQDESELIAANDGQSLDIHNSGRDSHGPDNESSTSNEMVRRDPTPPPNRKKTTKPKDRVNATKNPPTANGYLSMRQSLLNATSTPTKAKKRKLKTANAVDLTELVTSKQNDPESEPSRKKQRSQSKSEQSIDESQNNILNETNKRRSRRSRNVNSDYIMRQSMLQSPMTKKQKLKTAHDSRHTEYKPKKSVQSADLAVVAENLNKIHEKRSMAPSERPKPRRLRSILDIHENGDDFEEPVQSTDATKTGQSDARTDGSVFRKKQPLVECEKDNHGHDIESRTSNGMVQREPTASNRKKNTKPKEKTNAKNPPTRSKSKTKQSKATEEKENEPPNDVILAKMDSGKPRRNRTVNNFESLRQSLLNAPAKAEKRKSKTANLHRKEPVVPFRDDTESEPPRKKQRSQSQIEHKTIRPPFSTSEPAEPTKIAKRKK